jgi:hypothetical protein
MKITLYLGEDEGGSFGVLPLPCQEQGNGGFNAFWGGNGQIHHDVFEHYFEFEHKYFLGDYACNILGEIVATGHTVYYVQCLQCSRTTIGGGYLADDIIISDTFGLLSECTEYGLSSYGHELMCNIPKQSKDDSYIEFFIEEYLEKLKTLKYKPEGEKWYKSITPNKIINALRWGYKQARRRCPDTNHNRIVMDEFLSYWNEFCEKYTAENLSYYYDRIIFDTHLEHGNLVWNAWFREKWEHKLERYNNLKTFEYSYL